MRTTLYTCLLVLLGLNLVKSQDIEAVKKADPVTVNGGLNISSGFYDAVGINRGAPPFYWRISANLNVNFFGVVNAPFNLNFSPQGNLLSYPYQQMQPFNQMGISPAYKGIKLHLGYRSMILSKYSLSGSKFYGAGLEVEPKQKKWQTALFYGRLARAVNQVDQADYLGAVLYNRNAAGGKISYVNKKNKVSLIVMKGWDVPGSVVISELQTEIPPEENLVTGVSVKQTIARNIELNFEYSLSAYTRNVFSEKTKIESYEAYRLMGFTSRTSSQFNKAIEAGVKYNNKRYNAGISYRRIDPGYRTMGMPFTNNDLEDITANLAWRMLKDKINITTSGGLQKNNLDHQKESRMSRTIGSVNMNYNIHQNWNMNLGYSNFNTSTTMIRIKELDSLNYYQVTKTIQGGVNFQKKANKTTHAVTLMSNYQEANDITENNSELFNTSAGYTYGIQSLDLISSLYYNANVNSFVGIENIGLGPLINLSKSLFNKSFRVNASYSNLNYTNDGNKVSTIENYRIALQYTLNKKHNISFDVARITKSDQLQDQNFRELRGTVNYSYNFSKSSNTKSKT